MQIAAFDFVKVKYTNMAWYGEQGQLEFTGVGNALRRRKTHRHQLPPDTARLDSLVRPLRSLPPLPFST